MKNARLLVCCHDGNHFVVMFPNPLKLAAAAGEVWRAQHRVAAWRINCKIRILLMISLLWFFISIAWTQKITVKLFFLIISYHVSPFLEKRWNLIGTELQTISSITRLLRTPWTAEDRSPPPGTGAGRMSWCRSPCSCPWSWAPSGVRSEGTDRSENPGRPRETGREGKM